MRLNDLGYSGKNGKKLDEDGIYGENTKYAIEKFQKDNSLTIDGIVGPETSKKLNLLINPDVTDKLYKKTIQSIYENVDINKYSEQIQNGKLSVGLLLDFYNMVHNGAVLDLKNQLDWQYEYFIFDDKIVRSDAPGNIAYGIAGRILGLDEDLLLFAAGFAQKRAGTSDGNWEQYYGDDPIDQVYIRMGYNYMDRYLCD